MVREGHSQRCIDFPAEQLQRERRRLVPCVQRQEQSVSREGERSRDSDIDSGGSLRGEDAPT